MKKFRKPRCPHCGRKLGLLGAWMLRTQGEYVCPKCGGVSNVVLDRSIYGFAFLTVSASAVFFLLAVFGLLSFDLWLLLLVLLPFLLFYLISVFLVRLKKPAARRRPPVRRPPAGRPAGGPGAARGGPGAGASRF